MSISARTSSFYRLECKQLFLPETLPESMLRRYHCCLRLIQNTLFWPCVGEVLRKSDQAEKATSIVMTRIHSELAPEWLRSGPPLASEVFQPSRPLTCHRCPSGGDLCQHTIPTHARYPVVVRICACTSCVSLRTRYSTTKSAHEMLRVMKNLDRLML